MTTNQRVVAYGYLILVGSGCASDVSNSAPTGDDDLAVEATSADLRHGRGRDPIEWAICPEDYLEHRTH
jgi:hypothetical protein